MHNIPKSVLEEAIAQMREQAAACYRAAHAQCNVLNAKDWITAAVTLAQAADHIERAIIKSGAKHETAIENQR